MPQATNLVVKNGATPAVDKTYVLITPASGDGGIAVWNLKEGPISAVFPSLTAMSNRNANGTRRLTLKYKLPSSYTESVTGLTNVGSRAEVNVDVRVPEDFPEALKNDFVAYTANIINSELIKSMMRDATPAT